MTPSTAPSADLHAAAPVVEPAETPDSDLLARVRAGDLDAYAELYQRHRSAALRLATSLAGATCADDLVAEAFLAILRLLREGRGPERAFRAYLFTAVRNTHFSAYKKSQRSVPVAEFCGLEPEPTAPDPWLEMVENELVAAALDTMPARWQEVIRLTIVEELPLDQVAHRLGISLGAVAQLSFRAREALRTAYLTRHAKEPVQESCRTIVPLIARDARSTTPSWTSRIALHLTSCPPCRSAHAEINTVAGALRRV